MGAFWGRILLFFGLVYVGLSLRSRTEASRLRKRSLNVRQLGPLNRSGQPGVVFEDFSPTFGKSAIDRRPKRNPIALTVSPYAERAPGPGLLNTQPSCDCE